MGYGNNIWKYRKSDDYISASLDSIFLYKEEEMAIDPVCKMQVEEKKAPAKSLYKGKMYYFCSPGCKKAFDSDPEKYLSSSEKPLHHPE
jgi:YHS domain-containing protein